MEEQAAIGDEAGAALLARAQRIDEADERLDFAVGGLNALHGRLVDAVVIYVEDPSLWSGQDFRSFEHFVCWKTGVSPRTAGQLVALARCADELPATLRALRDGSLSLEQAHEVARWVPWWADEQASRRAEDGIPLDVGRNERVVPERLRRIVILRDGGVCGVPGCEQRHWLEIHHIIHWENDGMTDSWNLVALCPHHHRMHHRGELGISGNADDPNGLRFAFADGRQWTHSGAQPETGLDPGPLCPPVDTYRPALRERFDSWNLGFAPPWTQKKWRGIYPPPNDHSSREGWKPPPQPVAA